MTTTWTKAALAYEAHRAELETARKQYEHAVADSMGRLREAVSARLGGELVHHSDTDVDDPGPGRSWLSFSLYSEDLEVAVVHAWSSAAYGGPPGTIAVAVEGKPSGVAVLGWGLEFLRATAADLRWPPVDVAALENSDLHNAGVAEGALRLDRVDARGPAAVAEAAAIFAQVVDASRSLVSAVRERAPAAWATYGGILEAATFLADQDVRLQVPEKSRNWRGLSYVNFQRGRRKVWVSVGASGQLVFSSAAPDQPLDAAFAKSQGVELQVFDGHSTIFFPEAASRGDRLRVKQLVIEAAKAHL